MILHNESENRVVSEPIWWLNDVIKDLESFLSALSTCGQCLLLVTAQLPQHQLLSSDDSILTGRLRRRNRVFSSCDSTIFNQRVTSSLPDTTDFHLCFVDQNWVMYQSSLGQLLTKRKSFGSIIINLFQLGIPTLNQKRFLLIGKERKGS